MGFTVGLRTLWIRATVTITITKASAVVPSSCTHQRASAQSVALCNRPSFMPAAAITSCQTCKIDWRGARGGRLNGSTELANFDHLVCRWAEAPAQ